MYKSLYRLPVCVCICQLPWGRSCVEHYRSLKRQCVFSHDELLFVIASTPRDVDIKLAQSLVDDLAIVIDHEKHLRNDLLAQVRQSVSYYTVTHVSTQTF